MPFDDAPPLDGGSRFFGDVNFDQPAPSTENCEPPLNKPPHRSSAPTRESNFDADFAPQFEKDLVYWSKKNQKTAHCIRDLVNDTLHNPYRGIGKPEYLKYLEPGTWSRRINKADRLLYRIDDGEITFLSARYHYGKHRR